MPWQIVHEVKGRMRLKGPVRAIDIQLLQQALIELDSQQGIEVSSCSLKTQTVLFKYELERQRQLIIQRLLDLPVPPPPPMVKQRHCQCSCLVPSLPDLVKRAGQAIIKKLFYLPGIPRNPLPGFLFRKCLFPPYLRYAWALTSVVPYVREGLSALRKRKLTVPVLDASALLTAFLRRDFSSMGTITFLFALSHFLEYSTHKKSRQNLAAGLKLLENKECWLLKDGTEIKVPLASVQVGDLLVLRSGDEIPVDGTVVEGEAMVNQASMTGESMPQRRTIGGWLHAGTAIEEGQVVLKAVNVQGDTRISRIIDFIDQAEELKAGVQMQAESWADALVPYSFAGAALVGLATRSSQKVASVLMVDYSCAIRLSTPLSILSAMRNGVDKGLLIKGGKFLEALALADTIVFDKTGTLTQATPQVAQVLSFSNYNTQEILCLAACLEEHFPHPLGRAVVEYADQQLLLHREEHAQVQYIAAHGIVSRLNNKKVLLGSAHFLMEDEGITPPEHARAQMLRQAALGRSLLYLAMDNQVLGMLAIADPPRSEAAQVIQALRESGLQIHMLTGDGLETAQAVAQELGIDSICAQMLPADKAAYLQQLKDEGRKVIMVGDGINDSPSLALANVGITLQDGSDLARNVADVVLTKNNLWDILQARKLGQLTLKRIKHNYTGIVAINSLLLLLGIGGIITPASSALLHNAATIVSAMNSMRNFKLD